MRSVIMIAYAFPPEGNAGAYRPLRFVRYLPAMGWRATVIALDTDRYERYDPGLLALVPSETEVVRVRGRDLWQSIQAWRAQRLDGKISQASVDKMSRLSREEHSRVRFFLREVVRRCEAWCYHPDMAMGWIAPVLEATVEVCLRKRPDVIWATGAPWSAFIVAQRASQHTGVPYVLDFRSSWTLVPDPFEAMRPAWARRRDRKTLYKLLKGARAIIFFYDTEAECYWRAYRGALDISKIHIIPNGYDGTIEESPAFDGNKCTILYTGTIGWYRYDALLQALLSFKKSDPDRAKQLHFLFVGEGAEELSKQTAALGLSDIVETAGPTSYAEITRLERKVHALLMLGRPSQVKGHEMLAGAKLFNYLKAGRPIVGVLPSDEAKKLLLRVGVTTVADVDSPSEIVAVFRRLLDAWSAGTLNSLVPDRVACQVYSAEWQTHALVRALEGAPAAEPFVPGSAEVPSSLQKEIQEISEGWRMHSYGEV